MNDKHLTKQQVYHLIKGSRVLDDSDAERAAYLISDPETAEAVHSFGGISEEQLKQYQEDDLWLKRVEYLKTHRPKKRKPPRTQEDYFAYALRALWRLSRSAESDGDRIKALKELAVVAKTAPDVRAKPSEDGSDKLAALMGGQ